MKSVLLILTVVFSLTAVGAIPKKDTAPYIPEVYKALRDLEDADTAQDLRIKVLEEAPFIRAQRVVYDVPVHGGGIGMHALGKALPAKSIVTRVWFQVGTAFVDAGAGTVAIQCGSVTILPATDLTALASGSLNEGTAVGTVASMITGINTNCELTAVVVGSAQTAGKLMMYVGYVEGL